MAASEYEILAGAAAGAWAIANTVFSTSKLLGERRDVVILGTSDGKHLARPLKEHIYFFDWLPIAGATMFLCLAVIAAVYYSASLLDSAHSELAATIRVVSGASFVAFGVLMLVTIDRETRLMWDAIRNTSRSEIKALAEEAMQSSDIEILRKALQKISYAASSSATTHS